MEAVARGRAGLGGRVARLVTRLSLAALLAVIAAVAIVEDLTAERVQTQLGVAFDVTDGFWAEPHEAATGRCHASGRWGALAGDDVRVLDGRGRVIARSVVTPGRLVAGGTACRFDLHGVHVYVPVADAYVVELSRTALRERITAGELRAARPSNVVLVALPAAAPPA